MIIYEMMSWDQANKTHLIPWGNLDPISIMNSVGKGKRPSLPNGNQNMLILMVKFQLMIKFCFQFGLF